MLCIFLSLDPSRHWADRFRILLRESNILDSMGYFHLHSIHQNFYTGHFDMELERIMSSANNNLRYIFNMHHWCNCIFSRVRLLGSKSYQPVDTLEYIVNIMTDFVEHIKRNTIHFVHMPFVKYQVDNQISIVCI